MNRYTLVLFHCLVSALRCCQGRQGTSFSLDLVRGDSVYFFTGLMRRSVSSKKRFSNRNAPFNTSVDNVAVRNSIYVLDGLLYRESDLWAEYGTPTQPAPTINSKP